MQEERGEGVGVVVCVCAALRIRRAVRIGIRKLIVRAHLCRRAGLTDMGGLIPAGPAPPPPHRELLPALEEGGAVVDEQVAEIEAEVETVHAASSVGTTRPWIR